MLFHNSHLIQSRTPLLHDHTKSKRRSHALWDWNQNKNMKKSKRLVKNNWTKYLNLSPSATSQDYMLFMPDCITRRLKHISLKKLAEANKVQAGGCIFKNTYKVKVKIFRPQKSSMTCPIKSINVVCTYSHYFFIMYLVHVL